MTQCLQCLQYEPENSAEGRLAAQAREDLTALDEYTTKLLAIDEEVPDDSSESNNSNVGMMQIDG